MTAIPASTYRLQFHRDFTFREAAALVPYLDALGVGACYASPYLKATPGTLHGYDICDHNALNPDLGSRADYDAMVSALTAHGLGQIVDFVPNHMGIDPRTNGWWRDVLENGPSSPFAGSFDIDWSPITSTLEGKVLLPILGDQYGLELERGRLVIAFEAGALHLRYYDHDLPINPRQAPRVYRHGLDALRASAGEDSADVREFLSILTALQNLPPYTERSKDLVEERQREKEVARERLARLVLASPAVAGHIAAAVRHVNGTPGDAAGFDALHELLEAQAYRLAYWRTAFDEINYRRFFDINELAGLRMEDPEVFERTHGLLGELLASGAVTGVRVDHPDGLYDPAGYFTRLQALAREAGVDGGDPDRPLWLLGEKILSPGEALPPWPVHGTTGYDFLNDLNGLFVDPASARALRRLYARVTGIETPFTNIEWDSKRQIMRTSMASELNVLAHALDRLTERDRRTRDFTLNALRRALLQVVAAFPIYRTYVSAAGSSDSDRPPVLHAIAEAQRRDADAEPSIFVFLQRMLLPFDRADSDAPGQSTLPTPAHDERLAFAMKFQQYTGPVQAKGVEDTAFYRYNLLISLNEVGGDPTRIGRPVDDFHAANADRRANWPFAMTTTATHDTKRGEDARARINVLSEIPDEWRKAVFRWMRVNASHRRQLQGRVAPDRNDEFHYYQALLAAWPPELEDAPVPARAPDGVAERLTTYMRKATREAKVHTSWLSPHAEYDEAVERFVTRTLAGPGAQRFVAAFLPFQRRIARLAVVNSLSQVLLKMASPGVPDVYQGGELWDFNLVDPDNRRPVDFAARQALLDGLRPSLEALEAAPEAPDVASAVAALLGAWPDGRIKLWVTARALRLRRKRPALFLEGSYDPLASGGPHAARVVAFARRHGDETVLALAPRLARPLVENGRPWPIGVAAWITTYVVLPDDLGQREFVNVLTGERVSPVTSNGARVVPLAAAFRSCPVALLSPL